MASTVGRLGLTLLAAACTVAGTRAADGQSAGAEQSRLLGTWRGTSVCTDRVASPACKDETVVYEFTVGPKPGTVRWVADKVVNGRRVNMGELELGFDQAEGCWKAEFVSPRVRSIWRLVVDGERISGTGRLLPGNEIVRKIDVRKDEPRHRAPEGRS